MQKNKQYPARHSGIAGPPTSAKEAAKQTNRTHSYNLNRATQHRDPDRSRSRNQRSRSPKCAIGDKCRAAITTDRYAGYAFIDTERRQICWAHLLRDLNRIGQRQGLAGRIGRRLLGLGL